jgi:hypothetical protein
VSGLAFLLAPLLYLASHEGGHFLTALLLGCKPRIRLERWHFVVGFTYGKQWQRKLICEAGFGAGLLAGLALVFLGAPRGFAAAYHAALALHFWAYPWTALEGADDFEGMAARNEKNDEGA